tara:strand:+ start:922 stop:1632 length:711 start_codon:yes stop_codon:yes gene_type:complete
MSKKNFYIYLEFSHTELNIAAFNKINNKLEYSNQKLYKSYFNNNELNFDILQNFVEKNILEVEKAIGEFVKDIYLMIETPQSTSINLSVLKNNEGNKITKQDVMYLIQDAKQQILKSNSAIEIIHIITENYNLDDMNHNFLPLDINCKKFSIDIKFICFPKDLLRNFEQLFLKQQIFINKFICSNYVKTFNSKNNEKHICEKGKEIVEGINKEEVVSIPKIIEKTGFFERLFHFFK